MQSRIVQQAQKDFFQYGYSRVTLSEIATNIGISKKTIYNYFSSKDQLLHAVLDNTKAEFDFQVSSIERRTDISFREMVLEILSILGVWVSKLKVIMIDLRRNNSEAYTHILRLRKEVIIEHAMRVLKKGESFGVLDDNTRSAVAVFLFIAATDKVTDVDFRKNFPVEITSVLPLDPVGLFQSVLEVIFYGIKKS